MDVFLVFSTVTNRATARKIVQELLRKRLIACARLTPPGESHYWWKGKIEKAWEVMMILKTSKKALPLLIRTLKRLHPYQTPEILAVRIDHGHPAYLKWVINETK